MTWKQCSKQHRCAICDHDGWCTYIVGEDGQAIVRCMRIDIAPYGWRRIKIGTGSDGAPYAVFAEGEDQWNEAKAAAWLRSRPHPKTRSEPKAFDVDRVLNLADDYWGDLPTWSTILQIPTDTLDAMGCIPMRADGLQRLGLRPMESLLTPMHDKPGSVCGYRVRPVEGKKISVPGSRNGLFGVHALKRLGDDAPVHMPEGETDTAVLAHCKYAAIGRPNNSAGAALIAGMLDVDREIVLWADNDAPKIVNGRQIIPGMQGAMSVARHLVEAGFTDVNVATTAIYKDLRDVWRHVARGNVRRMIETIGRYPRQRMTMDTIKRYQDRMGTEIILPE